MIDAQAPEAAQLCSTTYCWRMVISRADTVGRIPEGLAIIVTMTEATLEGAPQRWSWTGSYDDESRYWDTAVDRTWGDHLHGLKSAVDCVVDAQRLVLADPQWGTR